jgi:hypothetical protein
MNQFPFLFRTRSRIENSGMLFCSSSSFERAYQKSRTPEFQSNSSKVQIAASRLIARSCRSGMSAVPSLLGKPDIAQKSRFIAGQARNYLNRLDPLGAAEGPTHGIRRGKGYADVAGKI